MTVGNQLVYLLFTMFNAGCEVKVFSFYASLRCSNPRNVIILYS